MITLLAIVLAFWLLLLTVTGTYVARSGHRLPYSGNSAVSLSILVAARNEEANITACLGSIAAQEWLPPSTEIIVVDDHSEDKTAGEVQAFQATHPQLRISLHSLSGTYGKKAALRAGMTMVTGDYLYLTDADCTVSPTTIKHLLYAVEEEQKPVAFGPVLFRGKDGLQHLLMLENLNNQCTTEAFLRMGKPLMANAANMMLHRSIFPLYMAALHRPEVSGDDVFFAHQLAKEQYVPCYFPGCEVFTDAPAGIGELLQQRLRWASKSRNYSSLPALSVAGSVWCINTIFAAALLIAPFSGPLLWPVFFLLAIKAVAEYAHHRYWFRKYGVRHDLLQALVLSCVYPFYVLSIGVLVMAGTGFKWKGRYHNA